MKTCTKCGEPKALTEFHKNSVAKDGLAARCKPCRCAASKRYADEHREAVRINGAAWYRANPERARQTGRRNNLRTKYSMTVEDYDLKIVEQDGLCGVCPADNSGKVAWAIDHDHACCPGSNTCGLCIRGLLCVKCNTTLPAVESDWVQRAEAYLAKWRAIHAERRAA